MDEEKKCGTCQYHRKQGSEWMCFNEHCDGFALETDYNDGEDCDGWEER